MNDHHHDHGDLFQDHSVAFLEMALTGAYHENPAQPDAVGYRRATRCTDSIEMYIMVEEGRLASVSFATDGCLTTNACGSCVAHLATGRSIEAAWKITPQQVFDHLETLPEDHLFCAEMAVGALQDALKCYRDARKHPWKKPYRRFT